MYKLKICTKKKKIPFQNLKKFSFGEYSIFYKKFNYSKKKFIYEYVINAAYK